MAREDDTDLTRRATPSPLARAEVLERIRAKTDWQVEQFLRGRERGETPTLETKRTIEGIISTDYFGRTLIELIQNAHDAQDKTRTDGKIAVVLDDSEGEHGVLYVANSGHPLTAKNFKAITDVAVSDKPPNEGIGNKGVGFKSVLQLSLCPEVYSRSQARVDRFDGYTFRFGRPEDFRDLAREADCDDPDLATTLEANISTLKVTIPIVELPDRVAKLGADGFCTVIRVPLSSDKAKAEAHEQLNKILESTAPLHLFLKRIEAIDLLHVDPEGVEASTALRRRMSRVYVDPRMYEVELQDGSRYLLAQRTVDEAEILSAIRATVEAGANMPGWDEWEGDAEVVIAISLGDPLESPRLYNFLPMGQDAHSVLQAHVQAPFFSSLDRRALRLDFAINALLIEAIADLAAELLVDSSAGTTALPREVVADLACWAAAHVDLLHDALSTRGANLKDLAVVPTGSGGMASPVAAAYWNPSGTVLTADRLPAYRHELLVDPTLSDRLSHLEQLYSTLGLSSHWDLSDRSVLMFAEDVAKTLLDEKADASLWADFYDELADAVPRIPQGERPRIVVTGEGLLRTNVKGVAARVFFPPQRGDTEERDQPPSAISKGLSYLRSDIPWRARADQPYRRGRTWLAEHVADFDTAEILKVVAATMHGDQLSFPELRECLLYAFAVWRSGTERLRKEAFPRPTFRVPTATGWVDSDAAHFGRGWGGIESAADDRLSDLLQETNGIEAFDDISAGIVLSPATLTKPDEIDEMRAFLEHSGVRHGLWPVQVDVGRTELIGDKVNNPSHVQTWDSLGPVSEDQRNLWVTAATHSAFATRATYETVPYRLTSNTQLPGQNDWDHLTERAKRLFGELVVIGLDAWPDSMLRSRFYRQERANAAFWPSLMTAFLEQTAWVPQTTPGDRSRVTLHRPGTSWWVNGDVPDFLPGPSVDLRRAVGATAVARLERLGARRWDMPSSVVERIDYLTDLVESRRAWSGTRTAYHEAWNDFVRSDVGAEPRAVIAERLGTVEKVSLRNPGEVIYYAEPDVAGSALLGQVPVLRLGIGDRERSRAVGRTLHEIAPDWYRSARDADIRVEHPAPEHAGSLLDYVGPWLETIVSLVLAHQPGVARRGPKFMGTASRVVRTSEIALVSGFKTFVEGHEVTGSGRQMSCWLKESGRILVRAGQDDPRLVVAERAAEGIALAVEAPGIADTLRVALIDIQEVTPGGTPTIDDIAAALRLPKAEVEQAQKENRSWRPDMSALIDVLATVAPSVAEDLRDHSDPPEQRDDLAGWLDERLPGTGLAVHAAQLLTYADQSHKSGPVENGIVSLSDANDGLRLLGLQPLDNSDTQRRQFETYVSSVRATIIDALRDRFVGRIDAEPGTEGLAEYTRTLALPQLTPAPDWRVRHWTVPEEELDSCIRDWLDGIAGNAPSTPTGLPSVQALRDAQARRVTATITNARDTAALWRELNDTPTAAPIEVPAMSTRLRESGYLDFGRRGINDILRWLKSNGVWPDDMPLTLNRKELGITEEDVQEARTRKKQADDAARLRAASVNYGTKTYTASEDDLLTLAADLRDEVRASGASGGVVAKLRRIDASGHGGRSRQRTSGRSWRARPPSPELTKSIGLAGEVVAGEWIQATYGLPREETWRSGYRLDILGDYGDDSLGYDFEVATPAGVELFEVKASTGSDFEFTLGTSEVRRAVNLGPSETYNILFVCHVFDPDRRRWYHLPNPLGAHADLFELVERAMHFRFEPDDSQRVD